MAPAPVAVVLAAGQGTRMRSRLPKVLHPVCGRPLVLWPVRAAVDAGARKVVVVGGPDRAVEPVLPEGVALAVQSEARGTGDAVRAAAEHIAPEDVVLVLAGDVPLVTAEVLAGLAAEHAAQAAAATMVTMELEDPAGYGRVVRAADGSVERVVETKEPGDASPAELALREVNTGIFAFSGAPLLDALTRLRADNAQGEYYLPDVLPILREAGGRVAAHRVDDPELTLGVNDRADLADVQEAAQRRLLADHMRAGVTVLQPASTLVDADVTIGPDTVLEPGTSLRAGSHVGANCRIGPHTTLRGARVEDGASVVHSYLEGARVGPDASVGPFAYLRPGAELGAGAKAGTYVEVKNSTLGAGAKVPHLSYVGDADVGEGTNLGAGTITANYDGRRKHRTTIGRKVRGGVDTAFVAPVSVGDGAVTAAGSVVTDDVPPGALAVARARQRNVEDYAERDAPAP